MLSQQQIEISAFKEMMAIEMSAVKEKLSEMPVMEEKISIMEDEIKRQALLIEQLNQSQEVPIVTPRRLLDDLENDKSDDDAKDESFIQRNSYVAKNTTVST